MELETHAGVAPALSHSEARKVDDGILVACGLAVGAGSIHIAAGIEHLHDYALHSAFFWLLAAGQIGLGVALYRSPHSRWLWLGAIGSVAVVALWVVSRTVGLPLGPSAWTPEPVGITDTIASADELALAALIALWFSSDQRPLVVACKRIAMAGGLFLILMGALALTGGEHSH